MLHFGQIDFQVLGSSTQQLFLKALSQYFSSMFLNWLRLICLCLISSGRVFQTLVTLMKYECWKVCDLHFLGRNKRVPYAVDIRGFEVLIIFPRKHITKYLVLLYLLKRVHYTFMLQGNKKRAANFFHCNSWWILTEIHLGITYM